MQKRDKMGKGLRILLVASACFLIAGCGGETDYSGGIVQTRRGNVSQEESTETENTTEESENADNATEVTSIESEVATSGQVYILQYVDLEQQVVTLIDSDTGRERSFKYDVYTSFADKYGKTKSIASFELGYPVKATIDEGAGSISALSLTDEAWVYTGVVNYSIDMDALTMKIADKNYYFDDHLSCYSEGYEVPLYLIGADDTLTVVGMDKRILSMVVTSGHGYVTLTNTELFDGSYICIGDTIFKEVLPGFRIEVPEGDYLVTVANDGWGSSREITVVRGQDYVLDLDSMKGEGPKYCKLSFDFGGLTTAKVTIDGEEIDYSEPTEVKYGTHVLKISADGYDSIEKKLVVNSEEATIELSLVASGTTTDEDDASSGTDASTGTTTNNTTTNGTTTNGTATNETTTDGTTANGTTTNGTTTNGTTTDGTTTDDTSSQDYLTTLYNLLTAINNTEDN